MAGKPKTKKVQFEFLSPEAREVYLAGDFNHWDSSANPMKKDTKGVWKTTLPLRPEGMSTALSSTATLVQFFLVPWGM